MSLTIQERESLVRVKLLGNLKVGDKINTRYMAIQPDTFSTKISRYLYGENRSQTIIFCRNTINQVKDIVKMNADPKIKKIVAHDISVAKTGLSALQETYSDDVRVVSELEEVIQSIDST